MKDEGPFLLEFVAHHLVLGFDRLLIASNDCSDGTDDLLNALDRRGYVQHLRNVLEPGDIPQHAGYDRMRAKFGLEGAEWLMMLDADEFLHVAVGDGSVQALTGAAPAGVDIIALNSMTFGTNTVGMWEPGLVCAQFLDRLALNDKINGAVKSLTRGPERFRGIHNHHMVGYRGKEPLQVMRADGAVFEVAADVPLWKRVRSFPASEIRHQMAHYNHYAIKTADSFTLRRLRGLGSISDRTAENKRHDEHYFAARAKAVIPDDRIAVYAARVEAKMAEMQAHHGVRKRQKAAEERYAAMLAALG
ncbi:MAG: glycosyltransferase family 2 protein [Paracoccaceae bacterium]